jgi:2-dehydro-3-deoxyphosphogluconate aldolase/(4S)-4-hydroxy-2-oxoglutarate aldolase
MNYAISKIIEAPVMTNVFPRLSSVVCQFMEVLTEEGYPAIEILARPFDEMLDTLQIINDSPQRKKILVGAGTILTRANAEAVVKLKPDFIVSPGFSRKVLDVTAAAGIPYLPGVCTIQDIQDVIDAYEDYNLELKALKICPVNLLSYDYVKILGNMFPGITYCLTGTVTLDTLPEWKKITSVGPAMESNFVPEEWLMEDKWDEVRTRLKLLKSLSERNKR